MPKISKSQKWAKRYSNCKSSLFKALNNIKLLIRANFDITTYKYIKAGQTISKRIAKLSKMTRKQERLEIETLYLLLNSMQETQNIRERLCISNDIKFWGDELKIKKYQKIAKKIYKQSRANIHTNPIIPSVERAYA